MSKGNELNQIDVRSSTPEKTQGKGRLFKTVWQVLRKPDAISAHYDSKERTGDTRFIVINSADGNTHIQIDASVQGGGINPIGLERHDFVNIMWWNESKGETGQVKYVDRKDEKAFSSKVVSGTISTQNLQYLKETGGGDYLPGGGGIFPAATDEQLNDLATKLEDGNPNKDLTEALLKHRQVKWGAQQITLPSTPRIPPKV